jgi:hypothetical protein
MLNEDEMNDKKTILYIISFNFFLKIEKIKNENYYCNSEV